MADHDFQIQSDSPANDDLMFWGIVGHEALARPSFYELTVLSKNGKISASDILGYAFDVVIEFNDAGGSPHKRHCQGHAVRFVRLAAVGRHFEYRISLRSWFGLLTKRTNSRILQDKPVLDVLAAVFEDSPIKRFKKTESDGVVGPHKPLRYCVQHQESDYQFLSRLLESEGIYYWFDAHDAPGTMHRADASDVAHTKLPVEGSLRYAPGSAGETRFNEISQWVSAREFDTGKYASRDSDFKAIRKKLSADKGDPDSHELADFETFEFPGHYFKGDDTDNLAKIRIEELVARRQRHWAVTSWPDVAAGRSFTFEGDPDGTRDGDYTIAACTFVVSHAGYESLRPQGDTRPVGEVLQQVLADDAVHADTLEVFEALLASLPAMRTGLPSSCTFLLTMLPVDMPYRPPRLTPRVVMPGPQTAIVVGPAGDELHVDVHGRVKVHFHWDRYDESNEKSTCWVRVTQPWAGKGWGAYFIPRIGQEVIVDFLNGDPDRPIIVGRMYNDDQPIPFDSPTQSGFRTRSTPGGNTGTFNELRFEDKKGAEQVFLHAEKNQDIEVEANETHWVGHNRTKKVDHDETTEVGNNRTERVGVDESIAIGSNRTETVGADEHITVGGTRTELVNGNEDLTIGGSRDHKVSANDSRTVGANETITVSGSRTDTVNAALVQTVGAAMVQTIGASMAQTVNGALNVTSNGAMTFTAAGGFNIIAPGGTKIIDYSLGQIGGTNQIGYGFQFNFSGINSEANVVKIEATACTNAAIGMKTEVVGFETLAASAATKNMVLQALSSATDIEMDTLKLIL